MKTFAALVAGLVLGGTGVGVAASTAAWNKSQAGIYTCRGVYRNADAGDVKCVSAVRDASGGRVYVYIDNSQVFIGYAHPKRGGPIFGCRVGREPIGYRPGLGWKDC